MRYKVISFVYDSELEHVLNGMNVDGWELKQMFRNSPNEHNMESTTIVYEKKKEKRSSKAQG